MYSNFLITNKHMKKIVYFLGYSKKKTKFIDFLKKKKNINLKILFN